MKSYITNVLISVGILFALFAVLQIVQTGYGTHSDHRPCGQNAEKVIYPTAAQYYLVVSPFNESSNPKPLVGTCPYQGFEARTLALDVWLLSIMFFLSAIFVAKRKLKQ